MRCLLVHDSVRLPGVVRLYHPRVAVVLCEHLFGSLERVYREAHLAGISFVAEPLSDNILSLDLIGIKFVSVSLRNELVRVPVEPDAFVSGSNSGRRGGGTHTALTPPLLTVSNVDVGTYLAMRHPSSLAILDK